MKDLNALRFLVEFGQLISEGWGEHPFPELFLGPRTSYGPSLLPALT